jgi:hypothetical protein
MKFCVNANRRRFFATKRIKMYICIYYVFITIKIASQLKIFVFIIFILYNISTENTVCVSNV